MRNSIAIDASEFEMLEQPLNTDFDRYFRHNTRYYGSKSYHSHMTECPICYENFEKDTRTELEKVYKKSNASKVVSLQCD